MNIAAELLYTDYLELIGQLTFLLICYYPPNRTTYLLLVVLMIIAYNNMENNPAVTYCGMYLLL